MLHIASKASKATANSAATQETDRQMGRLCTLGLDLRLLFSKRLPTVETGG